MGLFKDLNTLSRQAKEINENSRPGDRLAEMSAKLGALNASMEQQAAVLSAPPGDAIAGSVQIVSLAPTSSSVNGAPVIEVSGLLLAPGRPPIPVTSKVIVPAPYVHLAQAGATLPAHLSAADPTAFAIDWATAAAPR